MPISITLIVQGGRDRRDEKIYRAESPALAHESRYIWMSSGKLANVAKIRTCVFLTRLDE